MADTVTVSAFSTYLGRFGLDRSVRIELDSMRFIHFLIRFPNAKRWMPFSAKQPPSVVVFRQRVRLNLSFHRHGLGSIFAVCSQLVACMHASQKPSISPPSPSPPTLEKKGSFVNPKIQNVRAAAKQPIGRIECGILSAPNPLLRQGKIPMKLSDGNTFQFSRIRPNSTRINSFFEAGLDPSAKVSASCRLSVCLSLQKLLVVSVIYVFVR